ncbi:MAG: hypothetical protein P8J61_09320 [Gammaproteobacteria bacterium]|nr:hypothetical protein [Gammaproteobacteria bacterium]
MPLSEKFHSILKKFIETESLPLAYMQTVEQWFLPLALEISDKTSSHQGAFILGINGSQGSGKSTLASLLVLLLQEISGIRSINISLDDFYLTLEERKKLAASVHPLLVTRGVPGTHDVDLAIQTLIALKLKGEVSIPKFNKANDDRAALEQWPKIEAPIEVIIIEGWCLGVGSQEDAELLEAVNELETKEDQGEWRAYVNKKLADDYQELFGMLDMLVMLKAPDFSNIIDWRLQQEEKLRVKNNNSNDLKLMNKAELIRFISHYERLTRHALRTVPNTADIVYQLNDDQSIQHKLKG